MSTDLELRGATALFAGAGPADVVAAAIEVANTFSSVVKDQKLYQLISGRQHVLIEGWQTVGTLVGVFAVKDEGVTQLPWPTLSGLWERPQDPGREPPRSAPTWPEWNDARIALARWEHHGALLNARAEGLAFGFTASYTAIKDGQPIGWGEGRCARTESKWVSRDDYALESMACTRGQSRCLAAPLRFIVKLAGYATTPAEETSEYPEPPVQVVQPVPTLGHDEEEQLAKALTATWPAYDSTKFIVALERRFPEGIPEPVSVGLRAWAWFCDQPANRTDPAPQEGAGAPTAP